ncbi:GGDEF domain-containing protein [Candidatus Microgenomates bacterium]|nr:GGDEF domain-containing protein [Candidatus Microgenomates bacterium]
MEQFSGPTQAESVRAKKETILRRYDDWQLTLEEQEKLGKITAEQRRRIISRSMLARDLIGARYKDQAFLDALTGLPNNRAFIREYDRLVTSGESFGLICGDFDRFKTINDTYGHQAGDDVLFQAAQRIAVSLRIERAEQDVVTVTSEDEPEKNEEDLSEEERRRRKVLRKGGEEINCLLPGIKNEEDLKRIAERIRAEFAETPFTVGINGKKVEIPLTISLGAGVFVPGNDVKEDFYRDVDAALYKAKERRNAVQIISSK